MVPRWVAAVLRVVAVPGRAEDAIGDLNEMHGQRVQRRGRVVANLLSSFSTLDIATALVRQRVASRTMAAHLRGPDSGLSGARYRNRKRWEMRRSIEDWTRDFIHAARNLRRAPGFTTVTVATLALAIGANAAIFSVIDTVLLDPLHFPASDRLVSIRASAPGSDLPEEFGPAPEFFVQYSENADMLEDLGMYRSGQTTVKSEQNIDRLFVTQATPSLFTTLGARPVLGRLPTGEDDPGTVGLISHRLWSTWFGGDPSAIGRSFEVSGRMVTLIGVMAPEFRFPEDRISVWIHNQLGEDPEIRPGSFGYLLVGRMTPGVAHDDLKGQLAILASRLPERFGGPPQYATIIEQHRPIVRSLEEELVGDVAKPLWLLLGTVGIVLLIACANVANLFIVRADSRMRDLSVRQALGAGRAGLIRAQMAEALLLAATGGVGAALLAWVGVPLLVRVAPENIPNLDATRLDAAALMFTAGVSILTACVFGLLPAIRSSKPRLIGALRQGGHGSGSGGRWVRDALVLLQTASALVLLVGSGLLMRSFWTLSHVDPGFDTEDVFSFQIAPQRDELNDGPSYARFHEGFMERVAAMPSVQSVGLTIALPLDEGAGSNTFTTEASLASGETLPRLRVTFVGGEYFQTMGIAITRGRPLDRTDHGGGLINAVVGAAAAEQLWPGEDPLGKRFLHAADTTAWITVVGVAEDIFLDDFRQAEYDPLVYLPMVGPEPRSWAVGSPAYVVKTTRAGVIAPEIRALALEVVPESPMYRIFTMEGLADRSMAQLSFTMLMLAIASGLALILGAVGVYGVLSYAVSQRTTEIAVRMALGAEARRVRKMVVAQGARVTVAGVVLGLMAAVAVARTLESLLFGVRTFDAPTFIGMSIVMLVVAFFASYIPARRASSVDPMQALRSE